MTAVAKIDWQALMTATIVPPAERLSTVQPVRPVAGERRLPRRLALLRLPECECPEFCTIDHDND